MSNLIQRMSENWRPGLTVALISIPLSISIAVASGATPAMGIITAVWAGLMASIFGGSHFNIVGPAGALTGILAAFALEHGISLLPTLAIVSAVFIFIAYILKLERYLILVPSVVMHGFSLGVALIIGLGQLNFAFGLQQIPKHTEFMHNVWESLAHIAQTHVPTFLVFLAFLIGLFVLTKLVPKIPAIITLTPFGILLGYLSHAQIFPLAIQTLGERFPGDTIGLFTTPQFAFSPIVIIPAMGIAFVAILETLISAKIADIMTHTKFNSRKEMFGLIIANLCSGMFGGLPSTGVFVRTGLNVKSGANNKMSATVNAIAVAIISVFLFKYFTFIPMAVIASILIFASIRMVEVKHFQEAWAYERAGFWLAILTAVLMVSIDTVIGLLTGTTLALLLFVEQLSKGQFELTANNADHELTHRIYEDSNECFNDACDVMVYTIKGELAYLNVESHTDRLENKIKNFNTIILRMREVAFMDLEGVHAFESIITYLEEHGKKVIVTSMTSPVAKALEKSQVLQALQEKNLVYRNTQKALRELGFTHFESAL